MRVLVTAAAFVALAASSPRAQGWDPDTVARVAVQDEGRIKPVDTYARWALTRIRGRAAAMVDGRQLTATEWLLDVLVYPEKADQYEVFLVENDEVLDAIGVAHDKKNRRDRYSWAALAPAAERLARLGSEYWRIDEKRRSVVQQQIVRLASAAMEYRGLRHYLDAGRSAEDAARMGGRALAIIPPPPDREKWKTWFSLAEIGTVGDDQHLLQVFKPQHDAMQSWLALPAVRERPAELKTALFAACAAVEELGEARGEVEKIDLEVSYYRLDLVYRAMFGFGLAFLLCAVWWLRPRSSLLYKSVFGALGLANLVLIAAIALRCVLRERPPVSTLYETILFITSVGGIVGLVIEAIQRRGIVLSVTSLACFAGMYLANRFEVGDARDTMPMLNAVLDTNFWLSTHVTTVTMGYSAGLLAAAIAHVYVLAKLIGARKGDAAFFRSIARTTYGVICFGLFFSLVGTILGGIWANYSWGRFWGWDPKENGALLICLAEIAILHGRLGGYLKELGICVAAIANGMVVAASWWGVNLLGIGLHSYGFTSGIAVSLFTFWGAELFIMALGGVVWLRSRNAVAVAQTAPAPTATAGGTEQPQAPVPEPAR